MDYFLIRTSEDGEVSLSRHTLSQINRLLAEDEDDEGGHLDLDEQGFLGPKESSIYDLSSGSHGMWVLIRGELITPDKIGKKVIREVSVIEE